MTVSSVHRLAVLAPWTLSSLILLLPFTQPFTVVLEVGGELVFYPVDIGLLGVLIVGSPTLVAGLRARTVPTACLLLLMLALLNAFSAFVHPTALAFQHSLRIGATALVVLLLARVPRRRFRPVILATVAVGVEQAVLAIVQVVKGRGSGWTLLGLGDLSSAALIPFGGLPSARGTFLHPYVLAGVAMVIATTLLAICGGQGRPRWGGLLATAVAAVPLGLTYSRMSVVAVALVSVSLLCTRHARDHAWGVLALLAGAGLPAVVTAEGWLARTRQSLAPATADDLTSGRLTFVQQAWDLIVGRPFFGVGPRNYTHALMEQEAGLDTPYHVHNVPLLAAAESGVAAGLTTCVLLLTLAVTAHRSGPMSRAIYCALLPYLMLDHFAYSTIQGLVLLGLWTGLVLWASAWERGGPVGPSQHDAVTPVSRGAANHRR